MELPGLPRTASLPQRPRSVAADPCPVPNVLPREPDLCPLGLFTKDGQETKQKEEKGKQKAEEGGKKRKKRKKKGKKLELQWEIRSQS